MATYLMRDERSIDNGVGGMGNNLESMKFFGSRKEVVKRENRCFQYLTKAEKWLAEPEVSHSFRRLTARAGQTSCTSEELICRLSPICDGML